MLTPESVKQIASDEIRKHCDEPEESYRVAVLNSLSGQPRLLAIYWDMIQPEPDGKYACRSTAVDFSCSEEMVRYRVRAMFAYPAQLVGQYEASGLSVVDHPTEKPPEGLGNEG
jgi:hypothetical protein